MRSAIDIKGVKQTIFDVNAKGRRVMKNFTAWPIVIFAVTVLVATGGQMYSISANSKEIADLKSLKLDKKIAVTNKSLEHVKETLEEIKTEQGRQRDQREVDQREQRELMLEIYKAVKD